MKLWMLKFHRWLALTFALPLIIVIATGLVLSFEPWIVTRTIVPGTLSAERVEALLRQHDPSGQARVLSYRSYDRALTISLGRRGGTVVDAATGEVRSGPSSLSTLFVTARRLHETMLIDAGWLVIASTAAMLAISLLGVLMGLPRIRNTLAGWHKAMAWGLLPLIILSPLTGLFISAGITFTGSPPAAGNQQRAPLGLSEAVRIVGERHDLSGLVWLRPQGARVLARLVENGEYRVYAVTPRGTVATPRNWPRLWHEGNFAGAWSALMNVAISIALIGLWVTGLWMWSRRKLRQRNPQGFRTQAAS